MTHLVDGLEDALRRNRIRFVDLVVFCKSRSVVQPHNLQPKQERRLN